MKIAALNLKRNFHRCNGAEWNVAKHREAILLRSQYEEKA